MRRRDFITLFGAAMAWPLAARAQQPTMPVVGYIATGSRESEALRLRFFHEGLTDSGYVEGQNLGMEYRWANHQYDRLPELAADLVHRQVAVIATSGGPASALAAKAATTTIPIVFVVGADPVKLGLVASLARPGGNLTGINFFAFELVAKRLELLRQVVPGIKRIAVLINPADAAIAETTAREVESAARMMGLQVRILNTSTSREINEAFASLARATGRSSRQHRSILHRPSCPTFAIGHAVCNPRDLWNAGVCRSRRTDELWNQPDRCVSPDWRLCRSHPQGHQAGGPAGGAVNEI